jgi:hypothetical protein
VEIEEEAAALVVMAENIEIAVMVQVMVQAETIALIHTKKRILIHRAGYFCNNNHHYAQCTYLLFFVIVFISTVATLSSLLMMMNFFGIFFALRICVCLCLSLKNYMKQTETIYVVILYFSLR